MRQTLFFLVLEYSETECQKGFMAAALLSLVVNCRYNVTYNTMLMLLSNPAWMCMQKPGSAFSFNPPVPGSTDTSGCFTLGN